MLFLSNQNCREKFDVITNSSEVTYTAVIAVRARDPYLDQAIASVLNQTLQPERIVVVINGTRDLSCDSMGVVNSFDSRVEGVLLEELGLVPALNEGISRVTTPYVSFVDSDDLWLEQKQEKQLAILNEHPEIDAVNGVATNFRDSLDGSKIFLNSAQSSLSGAMTFRSSVFQRFGTFDPSSTHFTHYFRWYSQAKQNGLVVHRTDESVMLRRIHSENGWVRNRERGYSELQVEFRALMAAKRAAGETR
jgi:glycosyltransferase involved in cell wall biosynthesis